MALKTNALLTLWAMLVLAAVMQASAHRAMLQTDALGLRPCSLEASAAAIASNCPQDGQRYQVCLLGPAQGSCRLESAGLFPEAQCNTLCAFQSA
ncbi:hypothetical protein CVIRNUC_007240 [Coccomyxa viridis]|uniref:Extracellular protein n=1 Tax=Coccomyxa viridis TaxID=1274662 RepID=A0AAV1IAA9_9CHLO|nr:hypothetical protein CVIRNUC_007240 [Coccomyxa viridis]